MSRASASPSRNMSLLPPLAGQVASHVLRQALTSPPATAMATAAAPGNGAGPAVSADRRPGASHTLIPASVRVCDGASRAPRRCCCAGSAMPTSTSSTVPRPPVVTALQSRPEQCLSYCRHRCGVAAHAGLQWHHSATLTNGSAGGGV